MYTVTSGMVHYLCMILFLSLQFWYGTDGPWRPSKYAGKLCVSDIYQYVMYWKHYFFQFFEIIKSHVLQNCSVIWISYVWPDRGQFRWGLCASPAYKVVILHISFRHNNGVCFVFLWHASHLSFYAICFLSFRIEAATESRPKIDELPVILTDLTVHYLPDILTTSSEEEHQPSNEQLKVLCEEDVIGCRAAIIYENSLFQLAKMVDVPVRWCPHSLSPRQLCQSQPPFECCIQQRGTAFIVEWVTITSF